MNTRRNNGLDTFQASLIKARRDALWREVRSLRARQGAPNGKRQDQVIYSLLVLVGIGAVVVAFIGWCAMQSVIGGAP